MKRCKTRIMIYDKYPNIVKVLQEILESEDFVIDPHIDKSKIIQNIEEKNPDLIIADISDNNEVFIDRLQNKDIPIIAISVHNKESIAASVEDFGGFLLKPFNLEELLEKISQLVFFIQISLILL